jgi:dihydrofolate reductase
VEHAMSTTTDDQLDAPAPAVTCGVAMSLDGFVAGPRQSLDNPIGERGHQLHRWMFERPDENRAEIDALTSAGAYVMGRNMFGPGRGPWDETWRGWWGDDPPYHAPVYVLTHHARAPLTMTGGTTFHFVTDGIQSALAQARAAAGSRHVAIAGGAATINQYLAAGLVDELTLHVAPVTLGAGERLFDGLTLDLEPVFAQHTSLVTHIRYRVGARDQT